jgi:hypothetical protein
MTSPANNLPGQNSTNTDPDLDQILDYRPDEELKDDDSKDNLKIARPVMIIAGLAAIGLIVFGLVQLKGGGPENIIDVVNGGPLTGYYGFNGEVISRQGNTIVIQSQALGAYHAEQGREVLWFWTLRVAPSTKISRLGYHEGSTEEVVAADIAEIVPGAVITVQSANDLSPFFATDERIITPEELFIVD